MCEINRFSKPPSKRRLSELWTLILPLIVEQTPTALLVDGQNAASETAPYRSSTSPAPSSIMAAPTLEAFTPPPGTHDRSNIEDGERHDMHTLTFFNRL